MNENYASIIKKLREPIFSIKGVVDMLITGSVARDEETISSDKQLMSDLDIVVLTTTYFPKSRKRRILGIAHEIFEGIENASPFFDISIKFSVSVLYKFKLLTNKNVGNFELFKNAVSAKDFKRKYNGKYSLRKSDLYPVNLLLIVRLWKQLQFNHNDRVQENPMYRNYAIQRNILDSATILLPNLKVFRASYKDRNKLLDSLDIDSAFIDCNRKAYCTKTNPSEIGNYGKSYKDFVDVYRYVYSYVDDLNRGKPFRATAIRYWILRVYRNMRRLIYALRSVKSLEQLIITFRWVRNVKEKELADALFKYHYLYLKSINSEYKYKELDGGFGFRKLSNIVEELVSCDAKKIKTIRDIEVLLGGYVDMWRSGNYSKYEKVIQLYR